jgi:transposase-like protein
MSTQRLLTRALDSGGGTRWHSAFAATCPPRNLTLSYLNNIIEQDHRFIKKRIAASLWFRSVEGALQTVAGYEAERTLRREFSERYDEVRHTI